MKKTLAFLTITSGILLVACEKTETLPAVTPQTIFSVSSLKHTSDSLNLGDSIFFTAAGKIFDTTNAISASLKMVSGTTNAAGAFTSSNTVVDAYFVKPLKLVITAATGTSSLYNWTAKFGVPGPSVARKTAVLTTASFENTTLSLSTKMGTQVVNDSKAVYIK